MTRRDRLILGVVLLTTVVLPLGDIVATGVAGAVRYAAADAFYYDTVARNIATLGRVSFDGVYPTNGFHPLWQVTVALVYLVSKTVGIDEHGFLVGMIVVSIALIAAALWLAARAFVAAKGRLSAWFLVFPVGVYGAFLAPFWYVARQRGYAANGIEGPPQLFGTLFSFMNGMESALSICIYALLAWRLVRRDHRLRHPTTDGLVLAALTLARLDLVFLCSALLVWLSYEERADTRRALQRIAGFVVPIGGYLVINRAYAGMFFPVSGATKSTFPHVTMSNLDNLRRMFGGLLPDVDGFFRFWRGAQIGVPAAFALVTATIIGRRWAHADRLDRFAAVSACGVVALATYNGLFVEDYAQGHWYFAVSIFWMSLAFVTLLDRVSFRRPPPTWLALGASAGATVAVFFLIFRRPECHADQARLLMRAAEIRAHYPSPPRLLEYDDGVVAFATGFPCMNAMGVVLDRDAAKAAKAGHLLDVARERHFDRLAVFSYNPIDFSRAPAGDVLSFIEALQPTPDTRLSLEYALPDSRFAIFRFDPPQADRP